MSLGNVRMLLCVDINLPNVDWTQGFVKNTEKSASELFSDKLSNIPLSTCL